MPTSAASTPRPTRWHNAGRHLWLGSLGEQDVAVIEKDGRYAAIDAAGSVRGVFPDLVRAQVALEAADLDVSGTRASR